MSILLFSHFCHVSRTFVGGRWSVVCGRSYIWSVVGGEFWFGRCRRWSVSNVVGGRCFAFLLVSGRFLFLRMVGGRCLNKYMVGGRWSVVGGWSVGGGFVLHRLIRYPNPNSPGLQPNSCNLQNDIS